MGLQLLQERKIWEIFHKGPVTKAINGGKKNTMPEHRYAYISELDAASLLTVENQLYDLK